MDLIGLIREKWTLLDIFNLFLVAFSAIQLFDCVRTFVAQQRFFKRNRNIERIKERANKTLLGCVLDLIDTRLGKVASKALVGIVSAIVYSFLFFATPDLVDYISTLFSIIAVGSWMILSNRNNRIAKRIEGAKPNIPR